MLSVGRARANNMTINLLFFLIRERYKTRLLATNSRAIMDNFFWASIRQVCNTTKINKWKTLAKEIDEIKAEENIYRK